ncbi:MAG: hypothetical protein O2856_05235 [Planctomycetota bacterium]|nr:hypothetical protein [Planctomycetota bacterium]
MQPQHYAAFLERIGHKVLESNGVHWFDVFSRAWTCFPFESQLSPAEIDISHVMDHRGVMARFCCKVDDGVSSFRQVLTDRDYSLTSLDPKARNKTRQGLEKCTCSQEDARELGSDGIELHAQTLRRQGRKISDGYESYWRKYFDAVSQCPAATVWASRYQGELASFLISFRIGSVENICIVRSNEELLKHRPNNAMLYTFLQHTLNRPETTEVCIGLQSLQKGMNSLDMFKCGMGFREQPIGQRIELRSTLGFAVPRSFARLAGKAVGRLQNEYAARLAGALSLYADQPEIRRTA